MKIIISLLAGMLLLTVKLSAQTNSAPSGDTMSVISPRRANVAPFEGVKPKDFEDYLVQLAWKNDNVQEGLYSEVNVRKEEIFLAKNDWTRNLTGAINMNESNFPYFLTNYLGQTTYLGKQIDLTKVNAGVNYPLWNLGFGVNFGDFIVRKSKVKIAREKEKIAEFDVLTRRQRIKAEVLTLYQNYLQAFEILKVRLLALDGAESTKVQIANLFSVNKAKFEDYNLANKAYYDALEAKLKANTDIKVATIRLEEVIGVKWENVERMKPYFDDRNR